MGYFGSAIRQCGMWPTNGGPRTSQTGAATPGFGGKNLLFDKMFAVNCMKIWTEGAGVSLAPTGSANAYTMTVLVDGEQETEPELN